MALYSVSCIASAPASCTTSLPAVSQCPPPELLSPGTVRKTPGSRFRGNDGSLEKCPNRVFNCPKWVNKPPAVPPPAPATRPNNPPFPRSPARPTPCSPPTSSASRDRKHRG